MAMPSYADLSATVEVNDTEIPIDDFEDGEGTYYTSQYPPGRSTRRKAIISFLLAALLACLVVLYIKSRRVVISQVKLNIHLKLDEVGEKTAVSINRNISLVAPSNDIFFSPHTDLPLHQPHITLYLTAFFLKDLDAVTNRIKGIDELTKCTIQLQAGGRVAGHYAMWDSQESQCLQRMSDLVVNATYQFAVPNQAVPSWAKDMPKKVAYIKKYGSPNVFDEFQPHVTLAYDSDESELKKAWQGVSVPAYEYVANILSVGRVGKHGTVLRGQDIANITIQEKYVNSH